MYRNAYALLGILQSYAHTGTQQQKCADLYAELNREGYSEKEMVSKLAGYLKDGLDRGNWFWLQWRVDPELYLKLQEERDCQ